MKIKNHILYRTSDGTIDMFKYTAGDKHNGPKCLVCEEEWCQHCNPEKMNEECGASLHDYNEKIKELEIQIMELNRMRLFLLRELEA
jgi:hypothetical protein